MVTFVMNIHVIFDPSTLEDPERYSVGPFNKPADSELTISSLVPIPDPSPTLPLLPNLRHEPLDDGGVNHRGNPLLVLKKLWKVTFSEGSLTLNQ